MTSAEDERVVRVLLPVDLIRRMDEALQNRLGGFSLRTELIREALDAYLLELTHQVADEFRPERQLRLQSALDDVSQTTLSWRSLPEAVSDTFVAPVQTVEPGEASPAVSAVEHLALRASRRDRVPFTGEAFVDLDEPLFGLHNRDYPSLWAASCTDHLLGDMPGIRFDLLMESLTSAAWETGRVLEAMEKKLGTKLTPLFPTNREKPQSAEGVFRSFAVGTIAERDGELIGSGPLFNWGVLQARRAPRSQIVGLTAEGLSLLSALEGLSPNAPHSTAHADAFLTHVRNHAPGDWWLLSFVLEQVGRDVNRAELMMALSGERPGWTPAEVSTNAAGSVARLREWGLVEVRQIGGRYRLTSFGKERVARMQEER
jgi:hypothetical protein